MQYRNLGRTGIKVSPYALGALMLATQVGNPDPEDSIRIIHKALDAGINIVDTADAYGDSEEVRPSFLPSREAMIENYTSTETYMVMLMLSSGGDAR
jgi:aryl-alcohol dehydrogenase-like predicted oxidoreductase